MFTGIIQNQGKLIQKEQRNGQLRLVFRLKKKENLTPGESIAVEGVCLTATKVSPQKFEADVIEETLKATTLGSLKTGDAVNLERSLKVGDRIGGHFITGHVDARGQINNIKIKGRNRILEIKAPQKVLNFVAAKGSIAIDGISLTVQAVQKNSFRIALIPYTFEETTLGKKKTRDWVNLEIDLIARYLKILNEGTKGLKPSKILASRMKQQGF